MDIAVDYISVIKIDDNAISIGIVFYKSRSNTVCDAVKVLIQSLNKRIASHDIHSVL